ncbi:MAG: hypothetical protein QOF02_955 [Blastocatellia bacterium]|jgi:hypothetical protein|nr:hypothetical protein [Blastocatellia bacterium]
MLQSQPHTFLDATARGLMAEENPKPEDADAGLEDAARAERDYARERVREELQREPTEQELDDWLRQQTEGY